MISGGNKVYKIKELNGARSGVWHALLTSPRTPSTHSCLLLLFNILYTSSMIGGCGVFNLQPWGCDSNGVESTVKSSLFFPSHKSITVILFGLPLCFGPGLFALSDFFDARYSQRFNHQRFNSKQRNHFFFV